MRTENNIEEEVKSFTDSTAITCVDKAWLQKGFILFIEQYSLVMVGSEKIVDSESTDMNWCLNILSHKGLYKQRRFVKDHPGRF